MSSLFALLFLLSLVGLPIAIIKPQLLGKLLQRTVTRRKAGLLVGGLTIVLFILIGITAPPTSVMENVVSPKTEAEEQATQKSLDSTLETTAKELSPSPVNSISSTPTPTPSPSPSPKIAPTPKPSPTQPSQISQPKTSVAPVVAPTTNTSGGYSCAGKTKCGEMTSCAEARYYLTVCGVNRLDGDNDGTPCESICN